MYEPNPFSPSGISATLRSLFNIPSFYGDVVVDETRVNAYPVDFAPMDILSDIYGASESELKEWGEVTNRLVNLSNSIKGNFSSHIVNFSDNYYSLVVQDEFIETNRRHAMKYLRNRADRFYTVAAKNGVQAKDIMTKTQIDNVDGEWVAYGEYVVRNQFKTLDN